MTNKALNPSAVTHAAGIIRKQIDALKEKIAGLPEGEERNALQAELGSLMESIGMKYTPNVNNAGVDEIVKPASDASINIGVDAALLEGVESVNVKVETKPLDTSEVELPKPSLWARTKAMVARNKKKCWGLLALVLGGGAAAAYYYTQVKNPQVTVSSVSATVEVVAPEVPETTPEVVGSVFTRIGDAVVNAARASKDFVVVNAAKFGGWVKGLFTATPENVDVTIEAPAVPA